MKMYIEFLMSGCEKTKRPGTVAESDQFAEVCNLTPVYNWNN